MLTKEELTKKFKKTILEVDDLGRGRNAAQDAPTNVAAENEKVKPEGQEGEKENPAQDEFFDGEKEEKTEEEDVEENIKTLAMTSIKADTSIQLLKKIVASSEEKAGIFLEKLDASIKQIAGDMGIV